MLVPHNVMFILFYIVTSVFHLQSIFTLSPGLTCKEQKSVIEKGNNCTINVLMLLIIFKDTLPFWHIVEEYSEKNSDLDTVFQEEIKQNI